MASFNYDLPSDLIKELENLNIKADEMMGKMVEAGGQVVVKNVYRNMKSVFKTTKSLDKGLKITRVYKTPSDDGINVKVSFYGYDSESVSEKYPKGKPIPLIAYAREYGTSRGEDKKPFFRKSFKKSEIESAMLKVQNEYLKGK